MTDQPKDFYKLIVVISVLIVGAQSFKLKLSNDYVDQVALESQGSPETIIYIGDTTVSTPTPSISTTELSEISDSFSKEESETTLTESETSTPTMEESESTVTIPDTSTQKSPNDDIKIYIPKITSHEEEVSCAIFDKESTILTNQVGIEEDGSTIAVGEINQEAWLTHNGDKKLVDVK